jgi:hypothetical protein
VAGQPVTLVWVKRVWCADPLAQNGSRPSRRDVQQPRPGDVDHPGDELGVVFAVRGEERRLVHTQPRHPVQPARVVDQRGAVLADRGHHGGPRDAELGSRLGHGSWMPAGWHPASPRTRDDLRRPLANMRVRAAWSTFRSTPARSGLRQQILRGGSRWMGRGASSTGSGVGRPGWRSCRSWLVARWRKRSSTTGNGLTRVLFFSAATSATVCSRRSCRAARSCRTSPQIGRTGGG